MALEFLRQTQAGKLQKLHEEMKLLDPSLDVSQYRTMESSLVADKIEELKNANLKIRTESDFGHWLSNTEYMVNGLLVEFLEIVGETKHQIEESDVPVVGMSYFRDVSIVNDVLTANKCRYLEEGRFADWVPVTEHLAVAKAKMFLEHGSIHDFLKIYVEMANGRPDGIFNPSIEHLTESTEDALAAIMEYCDAKWSGSWPWEKGAPYKLQKQIKESKAMNKDAILALNENFQRILREFEEGDQEKYAIISQARDMSDEIHKIIQRLGKISGEGILMIQDGVRTTVGDNAAANLSDRLNDPINDAAESLSKLRSAIDEVIDSIETGDYDGSYDGDMGGDVSGFGGEDDLGSPMDALGGNDDMSGGFGDEGDVSDELADMSLDGSQSERPKKEM